MGTQEYLRSDLDYVRRVVDDAERFRMHPGILLLWAVIIPVGFALPDFAPRHASAFWIVAGPLGGLLSFWIGWRGADAQGQRSLRDARRIALHWGGILGAIFLAMLIAASAGMMAQAAPILVLMAGLGWYLAGVYGDRRMLWLGLLLAGIAVAMALVGTYASTVGGLALGGALAAAALLPPRA